MPPLLIPVLVAEVMYALACTFIGARPDAPMRLRWPHLMWTRLMYGPPPAPIKPRPDYARIDRLERELGLVEERPMRAEKVCLSKDCDVTEIRTWNGRLALRLHDH